MAAETDPQAQARAFLAVASQFRLGELTTEQPHPLTENLSGLARENPAEALRILHAIDCGALATLLEKTAWIVSLSERIQATLAAGNSVFLCGCGATGRL